MAILPPPADAVRITGFLAGHPQWSLYWDKKYGLWRVTEDDPTPTFMPKPATRTP
jgi:hypothetical protein